ncbi:MAG: hypothetical protein K9H49_04540 [Bacteroidales bacterium]|nr:hypothetical protein [Bacteroidales bacterium]MCF8389084.1 hypothetical protein [Bacteroidales bacterium]
MLRSALILIFYTLLTSPLFSQDRVRTRGEAQLEWYSSMSRLEVEKQAKELATIDALERAFGRVVVQGNATFIENVQSGQTVETNSVFNMIANTSVRGEVYEEISCSFEEIKGVKLVEGNKIEVTDIRCNITIIAVQIETPPISFEGNAMNCLHRGCISEVFNSGDDLYFQFKSPVSGYLSIFLDDGETASRLLPYRNMIDEFESAVPVSADVNYVFFSEENNQLKIPSFIIDEYILTTDSPQELNRLFVIFCSESFLKPNLNRGEQDALLPDGISSEDFQKWLHKNRGYFKNKMQVEIIDLQILR